MKGKRIIYFTTKNKDKIRDFQIVFREFDIKLTPPAIVADVKEEGKTLLENARNKALANSKINPGQLIIVTDGGVRVPFLGKNWNHVLTRRLSGLDKEEKMTDFERAKLFLKLIEKAETEVQRRVYWEEAIIFAYNESIVFEYLGKGSKGIILKKIPKNFRESGYWIGYLWYVPEIGKTYMEMNVKEKIQSSKIKKELRKRLKNFNFNKYF